MSARTDAMLCAVLAQLEDVDTLDAKERRELLAALLVEIANLVACEDGEHAERATLAIDYKVTRP